MPEWRPLSSWVAAAGRTAFLGRGLLKAGLDPARRCAGLWVPGRVELFGKHTDYAGGQSLVTAVDRGLALLVAPRPDAVVHWRDLARGLEARFDCRDAGVQEAHWSNYLRTAARRLAADFGSGAHGVDVAMASDLPAAAGLSSSSALVVAAYLALTAERGPQSAPSLADRVTLAAYLGAVESGAPYAGGAASDGAGIRGGCQDQAAVLAARAGEVLQLAYRPLTVARRLQLPPSWRLTVAVSGVHARKSGAVRRHYNRLAELAAVAAAIFAEASGSRAPTLGDALEAAGSAAALERAVEAAATGPDRAAIGRRLRQFLAESEIVPAAAAALAAVDAGALGAAAERSQAAAEEWLGNQLPETRELARLARHEGAFAASAFGAGFGGSVWAVVHAGETDSFLERWRAAYTAAFPRHRAASAFFATVAADGAHWLPAPGGESANQGPV